MKFSIPYNGHNQLIEKLKNNFGDSIAEVYLAPDHRISATGRSNDGYNKLNKESQDDYSDKIKNLMRFCEKKGMDVNILFNPSFTNFDLYTEEGFDQLAHYISNLYNNCYITGITVNDPYLISRLNDERSQYWKDLKIHSSVNQYSNMVNRVQILESLGADTICLDRDINRNIELLKIIKNNTDAKLKLMVNEGCIWGCPFRKYHHERKEVYSGKTESLLDLRKSLVERYGQPVTGDLAYCLEAYKKNPLQLFRSPFVRPEDLQFYSDIVDTFKIAGREMDSDRLEEIVTAYVKGFYEGNTLKLIFRFFENLPFYVENKHLPKDFHKKMMSCTQNCRQCGYCQTLEKFIKHRNIEKAETFIMPDENENWYNLGCAYFELPKYKKAIECFRKIDQSHLTRDEADKKLTIWQTISKKGLKSH